MILIRVIIHLLWNWINLIYKLINLSGGKKYKVLTFPPVSIYSNGHHPKKIWEVSILCSSSLYPTQKQGSILSKGRLRMEFKLLDSIRSDCSWEFSYFWQGLMLKPHSDYQNISDTHQFSKCITIVELSSAMSSLYCYFHPVWSKKKSPDDSSNNVWLE